MTLCFSNAIVFPAHVSPSTVTSLRGVQTRRMVRPPRVAAPLMVLSDREAPQGSAENSQGPAIRLTGNNVALTESLHQYVEDKLSKVVKRFGSLLTKIDVHLKVEHNKAIRESHRAEVVAFAGKTILRAEEKAEDMYVAIDAVEERISRTVRKFKERKVGKGRTAATDVSERLAAVPGVQMPADSIFSDESANEKEDEEFKDVYEQKEALPGVPAVIGIVRRKVFPMPLQTVEEAVLCCEYVDHPWYLFRNAETKEICLVYKRNHGGYGLIEPSNPDGVDGEPVM